MTPFLISIEVNQHDLPTVLDWFFLCVVAILCWGGFQLLFQVLSFGLLPMLLLVERSLGNNTVDAKGGGRPSCPYLCSPCKTAGTMPEYSLQQHSDRLSLRAGNRAQIKLWELNWPRLEHTDLDLKTLNNINHGFKWGKEHHMKGQSNIRMCLYSFCCTFAAFCAN